MKIAKQRIQQAIMSKLKHKSRNYKQKWLNYKSALIGLHLVFGAVVFLLIVTRLWVRMGQGVPSYPKENAALMELASKIVHWSFYGVLLLLPISGGFAWFQLSEGAGNAHEILKTALLLLLFLHVAASLFHYFVLKSNLFKRMWW